MSELNDFLKLAKSSETYNFNLSPTVPNHEDQNDIDQLNKIHNCPSTESFATKRMNRAWTVCYCTTAIILMFLLFLWFYFEIEKPYNSMKLPMKKEDD